MIRAFHKLTITIPSTVPQNAFFFHFLLFFPLSFVPLKLYTQFHAHNATAQDFPFLAFTLKALLINEWETGEIERQQTDIYMRPHVDSYMQIDNALI